MIVKIKKILILFIVIIVFVLSIVFGFRSFTKNIYNQRTCDWANIDNLELHAKLDIPKISNSDCAYNEAANIKKAYFLVDKTKLDIERYIGVNNLIRVADSKEIPMDRFLNFDKNMNQNKYLYYRENVKDEACSFVLFNSNKGELYVTVAYSDTEKSF